MATKAQMMAKEEKMRRRIAELESQQEAAGGKPQSFAAANVDGFDDDDDEEEKWLPEPPTIARAKVSEKGCISVYGIRRMPLSYYGNEWEAIYSKECMEAVRRVANSGHPRLKPWLRRLFKLN